MASCFMPVEFEEIMEPLLPPDLPVGPRGGRPRTPNLIALQVIWYDLTTGIRWLGIEPFIAKRGTEHNSGLGCIRWVVERTNAWLKGLRRMRVRWDRLDVIQDAWNKLAMSVICFRLWSECPV